MIYQLEKHDKQKLINVMLPKYRHLFTEEIRKKEAWRLAFLFSLFLNSFLLSYLLIEVLT